MALTIVVTALAALPALASAQWPNHLPAMGIKGNSHMLMQDRNSDQLADLVIAWIDKHVEAGKKSSTK